MSFPWLFQVFSWPTVRSLKRDRERFFERQLADMPQPDRAVLARSEIREHLLNGALEAFRSGSRGAAWENALYARPWGFRLEDITHEVHLWHGELERNAPPAMGRYLAATIPNSKSRFYADEGHISLFANHMEKILDVFSQEAGG